MIPTLAPEAASNLPTIMSPGENPTGHSAFQRMYHAFPASQTPLRPYISASGATRNGAKPSPRKKTEKASWPADGAMPRSCRIWSSAGATMLADMVVTSWLAEQTMPTEILREDGQL